MKEAKISQPKEAEIMSAILREMGVNEFEPGVINQMLEFTYRYITEILEDSRMYSNYAKKAKPIELDDVKLAIQMHVDKSISTPPPRDLLLELARTRNSNPLPPIKPQSGIRLPPDRYCLSGCNVQLKASSKKGSLTRSNPLKPSISMVTTKTGNTSTVTLVQKPSASGAAPPQKIVGMGRQMIKVAPSGSTSSGASPKIQISSAANLSGLKIGTIKTEPDSGDDAVSSTKRKREEDYDES